MAKLVGVWDSGGDTADRYTVIVKDGKVWVAYGMSADASAPNGVNMYLGESKRLSDYKTYIRIERDKKVSFNDLPESTQRAIRNRISGD